MSQDEDYNDDHQDNNDNEVIVRLNMGGRQDVSASRN